MIQDEMEQLKDNVASDRVESFSQQVTNLISGWSKDFLHGAGVPDTYIGVINSIFLSVILVVLVYVIQTMLRKLITVILNKAVKINRLAISSHLINNKFPKYLAMIIPISIIKGAIPIILNDFPVAMRLSLKAFDLFFVFYFMWLSVSVINAFTDTLKTKDNFKDKPVESFAGLGAASAILLLIFKDTILGLVASIQVSSNDMVRIGDWITMPKYGVDGDVIKINLTTVKILNFDKTITTIPPYSLVTEAFQNWRGMTEAGGRRIKRAINIKQSTIHYINEEELEHFRKIQLLSGYIDERKQIIDSFNQHGPF